MNSLPAHSTMGMCRSTVLTDERVVSDVATSISKTSDLYHHFVALRRAWPETQQSSSINSNSRRSRVIEIGFRMYLQTFRC